MRRLLRIRSLRLLLVLALSITVVLIGVRRYYATRVMNHFEASNEAVANLSAVHRQAVALVLETDRLLNQPPSRPAPLPAGLVAGLDSLAASLPDDPELNALMDRLRSEARRVARAEGRPVEGRPAGGRPNLRPFLQTLQAIQATQQARLLENENQYRQELPIARVLADVLDAAAVVVFALIAYFFYAFMTRRDRLTRDELRKHKQLNQYLEAIPEGVVVVDATGQVVYVNQPGQELLRVPGLESASTVAEWARHTRVLDPETGQPHTPEGLPLSLALRGELSTRDLLVQTETSERYLNSHARPIYGQDEEIIGAVTILRDITDNIRREQALQQARLEAEQALRERDLFIANISHEIRTPLNAILGFSELLEKNPPASARRQYVDDMQAAGESLTALINDLLDVSKIEANQLELEPAPTVLAEVLREVGAVASQKARAKNLRYDVETAADLPEVILADAQRLAQVLHNLTDNAVKFTTRGGVRLAVRSEGETGPGRATLRFDVSDTGKGIEADQRTYIFNRFTQVANDRLNRSGGTGLGLSLVRSLVERMGGQIAVESEVGTGTTFSVRISFEVPPAPAPTKPAPGAHQPIDPGLRVLVVEDNAMNQKVVQAFLSRHRVVPVFANDGLEALERVKAERYDLILMDIQMPNMDGYTATRLMRQQLGLATPIVAMTAYAMPGERRRCLDAGMNEYIAKPVRMQQLSELLRTFAPLNNRSETTVAAVNGVEPEGLVDKAYLWEITDGDAGLLGELVTGFRDELPTNRNLITQASQAPGKAEFNRLAHKFCSSLNALALLRTAAAFKRLEEAPFLDQPAAQAELAGLFGEIDQALAVLGEMLEKDTLREPLPPAPSEP